MRSPVPVLLALMTGAAACGSRTSLLPGALPSEAAGASTSVGGAAMVGAAGSGVSTGGLATGGVDGGTSAGGASAGAGAGTTSVQCMAPRVACENECVDLVTDPQHCGACANHCGQGAPCEGGKCQCRNASLELLARSPTNGAVGIEPDSVVSAVFNCRFDAQRVDDADARLYGSFSGPIPNDFPQAGSAQELLLDPKPRAGQAQAYFPGERVTAWLGERLGTPVAPFRPYVWQYTAAVNHASPGSFVATPTSLPGLGRAGGSLLGDLDADGDLDVVVRGPSLSVLRNDGAAAFEAPESLAGNGVPALGDVDGDGDLDIANGELLLLNDGNAHFTSGPAAQGCLAFGDVDGDGDLDCIANVGYTPSVLLGHVLFNDGTGTMKAGDDTPFGFDCELADLDSDGDLDVVCVSPVVAGARAFLNDGHGVFSVTAQLLGEQGARAIALGDVDADGDVDLVVSQWYGAGKYAPNQLYLNDGKANFDATDPLGQDGGDIALGDLDGDGDLDVVYSHLTPYGASQGPFNPSVILLNNGHGRFSESQHTLGDPAFQWFALGDLNGDGTLDAFVFHQIGVNGNYSAVWLNH